MTSTGYPFLIKAGKVNAVRNVLPSPQPLLYIIAAGSSLSDTSLILNMTALTRGTEQAKQPPIIYIKS